MKLYTEEQVMKAIELAQEMDKVPYTDNDYTHRHNEQNIIQSLAPIELPSDEELQTKGERIFKGNGYHIFTHYNTVPSWVEGAKWVIEQILNQNK